MRSVLIAALLCVALTACGVASNIDDGAGARHVEVSECAGDPVLCECVQTAEASGVSTEMAQQACSQ